MVGKVQTNDNIDLELHCALPFNKAVFDVVYVDPKELMRIGQFQKRIP